MRSVEQHLAEILAAVPVQPSLDLAVSEAAGAVLTEPVTAPVPLPPFDNSAMDGYAVCASDLADVPVKLPVVGDISAGDEGVSAIRPGLCTRIMTGAPLPAGADAVVPVEWTDGGTVTVEIRRSAPPGNHIRRAGEDVHAGQEVLPAGARLTAARIGMLAAVGRDRVRARPRPRVVVLSTGSELREPGGELAPGQIWDSNSFMLTAAVTEAGAVGYRQPTVDDDPRRLLDTLLDQLGRADALITSGGVSMGARDVVKEVLTGVGTVRFDKVAMRPGKPQGFGLLRGVPIFTLPGNPVSAYVSFQVFVRPALRAMQGLPPEPLPTVTATLTEPVSSPPGLRHYLRAVLRDGTVTPTEGQGSHQLGSLARASGLIVVPENVTSLAAGDPVEVLALP
ncbi:molybdopterin molybdenumtransferase MoeA [Actinomadura craniellae]|uniref:Molybdopterin molybdenumtransferase n=1 Tax=Actinomadura craniellae TaxID=2231787 RepID=A0A365H7P8_9ACTN|nr:gephyrin-like molybdotransferase Glp [Actinomadura craniellae]RAY15032.1 molybdopterin molybdenumtransferase MoeA [Actinomadura craniellae]